jgi:RecB family exonuclease
VDITIKNRSELDPFQKLTLSEFSYSRIDTYEMCASKYFYSYIKKEPRQFNSPAVLGNIIHSVLENTVSSEAPLSLDEMKIKYEEYKVSYDPTNIISKDLIDVGDLLLEEFYDQNQDRVFNVHGKEIGFNFVIGNYSIIGFIDRIDVLGDSVHIVDYKTGKREVALKNVSTNLQMGIYALAASVMFPGKEITASLHYLRTNRLKSHTYSDEDLLEIKKTLIDRINVIVEDNNFSPTTNERICSFCDHSQSGACGVGALRLKKFKRYT